MIKRPQKAPTDPISNDDLQLLSYPVVGSRKLDGYRCLCSYKQALTSSMKPITNNYIQGILSRPEYLGLDGELIVGAPNGLDVFNRTTGPVRKATGTPAFTYYVFDIWGHDGEYRDRHMILNEVYKNLPYVKVLKQVKLHSPSEVLQYEQECVKLGFEGAMIRSLEGLYKPGRCTLKELNIFKRKPTEDDEAVVIGFMEQQENQNEPTKNELGNMVRSGHKANKVGKGTLGKLILSSPKWENPILCGTGIGLTNELRQHIWDTQEKYLGTTWTYKFQAYGSIDAPRQPILKGMRDPKDMTNF